jgi:DNA invertase Pin-like site-specific DNA recombinase
MTLFGKAPPPPSSVVIEYDAAGKRVTKQFNNAYAARRFFVAKLNAGKNPTVRVSSTDQKTASQLPDLQHWAKGQDDEVRWYEDKVTGTSMDRPAWNQVEAAIRSGKVSQLVVWRLDRLGRTASGLTALFDQLRERKVNLVSIKDGVDLATPAGRMLAGVLASVAQYETEVRRERQTAGIAAAKANGKRWAGSKPGERSKVTPTKRKIILRMKAEGEPMVAIAAAVHLSRPTVYAVLRQTRETQQKQGSRRCL